MEFCSHDYVCPPHHLIYKEDGEKKLVCSWRWCQKPIWGSVYNCVECGNRPVHNYSSSNNLHCLDFTKKLENQVVCSGCHDPVLGPVYQCCVSECSFFIHKSCAQLSLEMNHPLHPEHALSLWWFHDKKYCDACCTSSHNPSFFYNCNSCDFYLDIKCANHLPTNPKDCHQHKFFPLWKHIQFNCEACGEEITNLAHRECSICKLLVHKKCAAIPRKVKIKLHNHFLNLIYSPHDINKRDNMFCRNCGDGVNPEYAAYCCQQCSYVLHTECLRHFRDIHGESPESVPNKFVSHATHLIKVLNQAEDEGPHLGEIQHFSHQQHKLILSNDEMKDDKLCEGCMQFITSIPFYSCAQCIFFFHTRCVELPTTIEQYPLHYFHSLTLLPRASNKSGVFFCDLCSRHHRGFTYKCDTSWCGETFDIQCGSIPETLKHEGHQHLFYLAQDSKKRKCKACFEDNEDYVFVCTSCDFILGIRCANLSLVARHKYDTHLLKLTYATEDDSREYYCLICEEERDENQWFYYCKECDFPAHPECVLGNYPRITIGSTYKSEYHEHLLTFVQKTEDSLECDACSDEFDGVALECSECKFNVHPPRHYYPDCMWILSERRR
ncbi:uncharacterized protein LOC132163168 [Corylus avellana]|uniref:uncharacterized protein LOC132163168 n=1 Tax=Corylus avellana TaxID=13451 RepID=UPI00286BC53F|nr:uncharacterized protein LOC132163168 [Corylus avellana]